MIENTLVFNKEKRSEYGTGWNVLEKIFDYRGAFSYIPPENECFRKCLEFKYNKDFSQQIRDFIQDLYRCKNILTNAKIQQFCKKYKINLGVYNSNNRKNFPSKKQRNVFFNMFMTIRFVLWGELLIHHFGTL